MNTQLPENFDVQIIKALRGKKSMSWLSHRLGYDFNQVYLWETKRRAFYWKDFERMCLKLKRPFMLSIGKFYLLREDEYSIGFLLKRCINAYKSKDIARILSISPSKISRWLNGVTNPTFLEACELIHFTQFNLHEFLNEVVDLKDHREIQKIVKQKEKTKRMLASFPYVSALAPALGLKVYKELKKHKTGILANKLGITIEQEKKGLQILLDSGHAFMDGDKYIMRPFHVNTSSDPELFFNNCQCWSQRAVKLKKELEMKSMIGYRVFGISEKGLAKLRKAQIQYYEEVSKVLKDENGSFDHIVAMNFHTLVLDDE